MWSVKLNTALFSIVHVWCFSWPKTDVLCVTCFFAVDRGTRLEHPRVPLRGTAFDGLQGHPQGSEGGDGGRAKRAVPPPTRVPDVGAMGDAGGGHREGG